MEVCDADEKDRKEDAVRECLPGSKWSPKICSVDCCGSVGTGDGLPIGMALDRGGIGVGGGDVESLEMLFIGERYPLKLPERG